MYNLERDVHGFACAISKDGQWLIHLQPGTVLTEHNIEMIVRELNAGQAQKEREARERAERALKILAGRLDCGDCPEWDPGHCKREPICVDKIIAWALAQA